MALILSALGIIVDMTPGIKIYPVRWLLAWIGKQINADTMKKVETLEKTMESHIVDSWRAEVLDFANSCINRRRHTKEEFNHVIKTLDKYGEYVEEKKIKNGEIEVADTYIRALYLNCCKKNSFLKGEFEEGEDDT